MLPAAATLSAVPPDQYQLGLGGELHVWNVRLCAHGHPELYFRVLDGGVSYFVERVIPDDAPFDADPQVYGIGDSFAEAWDSAARALEHEQRATSDGGAAVAPDPAACAPSRATAPSHGPETAPASPDDFLPPGYERPRRRTAPHASTTPAAGGHGRPGRLTQQELAL